MKQAKIVAVWGNNGSGKTMVSLALANKLSKKNDVIVINSDKVTPMLNVYLPFINAEKNNSSTSIAPLLVGKSDSDSIKNKIHLHPKNSRLGFMALSSDDNSLIYQSPWQSDNIYRLVDTINGLNLADYIIMDCQGDVFSDNATLFALQHSHITLRVTSPDNRGIAFTSTNKNMLSGGDFHYDKHILIVNNVISGSPIEQLYSEQGYQYILPHSKEVYAKFVAGELIEKMSEDAGYTFEKNIEKIVEGVKA